MRFNLELNEDQVHEMVVSLLQEDYKDQEYWMNVSGDSKGAKRIQKHLRAVLRYYMIPDEFKEWENQNAKN